MGWEPELRELRRREELARRMGGEERVARQHASGRLTVRERIDRLLDAGSFHETGALAGRATYGPDGELEDFLPANTVVGQGRIAGRRVALQGDDFTVRGGAADAAIWEKAVYAERLAHDLRMPLVRLVDGTGGGGSVKTLEQMGFSYVPPLPGFDLVVGNLATVPVVAAALGPVAGLGAARVVCSHFSVIVQGNAQLFVAGPPVVAMAGMGETPDKEELGGARLQARAGAVDNVAADEDDALDQLRRFLSYLPDNVWEAPPVQPADDPVDRREEELAVDRAPRAAQHVQGAAGPRARARPGLAVRAGRRLRPADRDLSRAPRRQAGGRAGVRSGALRRRGERRRGGEDRSLRGPLRPVPAAGGELRRRARLPDRHRGRSARARSAAGRAGLFSVVQATVPWVSVLMRKVYGVAGAGHGDGSRLNLRFAWPSGSWGSLPLAGGLEAAYRRELAAAPDPEALREEIATRLEAVTSPFRTAERFSVEEIIDPRDTRPILCDWAERAHELVRHDLHHGPKTRGLRP